MKSSCANSIRYVQNFVSNSLFIVYASCFGSAVIFQVIEDQLLDPVFFEPCSHGIDTKLHAVVRVHIVLRSAGLVVQDLNPTAFELIYAIDAAVDHHIFDREAKFLFCAKDARFGLKCAKSDKLPKLLGPLSLV